ncbi:rRNA methyltransferase [Bowdeniella nasicola]|uniref:rRNA methyltransferase n=1 Tax=Bowdeniella nasicola TaxID=208480 RepID=A0A1Q5Q4F6_9ACTO|nr:RNA methyltransferase [Bowdeniella nasicola]OKL54705.1 rRNA methyltransferase [Bowdeniella nasicola]
MLLRISEAGDLADYTRLTDVALRKKLETERGLFMAESSQVIKRAVAAGYRPRSFLMADRWLESMTETIEAATGAPDGGDIPVILGSDDALRALTGFHVHRGALAAMHRQGLPSLADTLAGARRVAILEDIVDHTNVGAAFRSAAALGFDAVLVTPSCADPLYRRSVRVSMGTVFQVPFTRISPWPGAITQLRELGFRVVALALADDSLTIDELAARGDDKLAVVLGTEGDGLARSTIAACDDVVRIPMAHGVDSLNVAAAAAVAFYALRAR